MPLQIYHATENFVSKKWGDFVPAWWPWRPNLRPLQRKPCVFETKSQLFYLKSIKTEQLQQIGPGHYPQHLDQHPVTQQHSHQHILLPALVSTQRNLMVSACWQWQCVPAKSYPRARLLQHVCHWLIRPIHYPCRWAGKGEVESFWMHVLYLYYWDLKECIKNF